MRVHAVSLVLITFLLFTVSCGDGGSSPARNQTPVAVGTAGAGENATGCKPARTHEPGDIDETITSGGLQREYILHVPASYTGDESVPLVLSLHGFNSSSQQHAFNSGLPAKADEVGFIFVTPQGSGAQPHWNFLGIEPGAPDDVAFIDDLLDVLASQLCIDSARVYVAGFSNGGAMSVTLGCQLSDRIAAIAPVAGVFFPPGCPSTRPVPVIVFHGTADPAVPFEGGVVAGTSLPVPPTEESVQAWAMHDGCTEEPEMERAAENVRLVRYQGCDQGATVELYVVEGGGHTWPGAAIELPFLGATTREISATDLLWEFFEAHPMP